MGRGEATGFLASCLVHAVALVGLALLLTGSGPRGTPVGEILGGFVEPAPLEDLLRATPDVVPIVPERPKASETLVAEEIEPPAIASPIQARLRLPQTPRGELGRDPTRMAELAAEASGMASGGGLEGRRREVRAALAAQRGGTVASEDAVERGLRWLVAHQLENGGWDFDHRKGLCRGLCRNPGSHSSMTAATSVALLALLGAGYTHKDGQYQDSVHRGLYYLTSRGVKTARGADFMQGTMYAQGLSAIALCEAYAMTGDEALKDIAQQAIDFIVYAQDKRGGGWRYTPGEIGDTTVTGWQLMALRSGQMAGLQVPSPTIVLASKFLDGVQSDGGALYGYMDQAPRNSTTSIGLLCRMYLGWTREHPALARGIAHLDKWGPSKSDIYYNYYATQVMHHWEGPEWERWNAKMRDSLVRAQATEGHEAGSWFFDGEHTKVGGRLFSTAAAVMTLEVYYRYLPLYGPNAVSSGH